MLPNAIVRRKVWSEVFGIRRDDEGSYAPCTRITLQPHKLKRTLRIRMQDDK